MLIRNAVRSVLLTLCVAGFFWPVCAQVVAGWILIGYLTRPKGDKL